MIALVTLFVVGTRWFAAVPRGRPGVARPARGAAALVGGRWWTVFGIFIVADTVSQLVMATFATPILSLFAVAIYDPAAGREGRRPAGRVPPGDSARPRTAILLPWRSRADPLPITSPSA